MIKENHRGWKVLQEYKLNNVCDLCRQSIGAKSKVYDSKGRLLSNNKDMCDCLDVDCMGCFYPCPECGSRKCGVECRCDRKWLYEQVEVEGGEIIRNKFAV